MEQVVEVNQCVRYLNLLRDPIQQASNVMSEVWRPKCEHRFEWKLSSQGLGLLNTVDVES